MATVSFINNTDNSYDTAQATSTSATHEAAKTTQASTTTQADTTSQADTVKISAAAQARVLRQAGQSVASIASALGTDTKTVDDYLGIAVTKAIDQALQAAEGAASSKA
jgi:hypothetical protein